MNEDTKVAGYVKKRIASLETSLDTGATKARLAELRRGIGKEPGELPRLWGELLLDMPEALRESEKYTSEPTKAEWAVYTALTLYALHQQGSGETVNSDDLSFRLGAAVRRLVHSPEDEERVMRRFAAMASSEDQIELAHHLRSVIQLLKAENVDLNYADLAKDLYNYQIRSRRNNVRLKWGRDYYRKQTEENKEGEE